MNIDLIINYIIIYLQSLYYENYLLALTWI